MKTSNILTTGREWRVILLFAMPIMGSNLLQVLYNLADSLIVGNFIGPTALGAVGLTGSIVWLLLTFSTGVGTGTSIVVAQYFGARKQEDIRHCIGAVYALAIALGAALTTAYLILAKPVVWNFLGTPPEMRDLSVLYLRIYACGAVCQMLYNVTYGILRAHGDSKGGILFLLAATLLNVLLDLLFIVSFGWGVAGAAIATVLAQGACALLSMLYLVRLFPHLRPRVSLNAPEREKMRLIVRVSLPVVVQWAVLSIGFTAMQRLVNSFGTASIEGYVAMGKLEELAHIPSNAFNSAVSAFAGQNIGAGRLDRAKRGYRASLVMGICITLIISVFVTVMARPMLRMFNISGESMQRGWEHLVLLMLFMPVFMTSNITSGFLQGTGDVRFPAIAGFVNLAIRLGSAFLLAHTFVSFRSIYVSMPIATTAGCLMLLWRYRSEKWRTQALV